jgi:hypothetical protein
VHVAVRASQQHSAISSDVVGVLLPHGLQRRSCSPGKHDSRRVGAQEDLPHRAGQLKRETARLAAPRGATGKVGRLDEDPPALPVNMRHQPRPASEKQHAGRANRVCEQRVVADRTDPSRPAITVNSGAAVNTAMRSRK